MQRPRKNWSHSVLGLLFLTVARASASRITWQVHTWSICPVATLFQVRLPTALHNPGMSLMYSSNGTQGTQTMLSCTHHLELMKQDTKKQRDALALHISKSCSYIATNSASSQSHKRSACLVASWEHGKEELWRLLGRQQLQHGDMGRNNSLYISGMGISQGKQWIKLTLQGMKL